MNEDLLRTTTIETLAKIAMLYAEKAKDKTESDFYDDVFRKMPSESTDSAQFIEEFHAAIDSYEEKELATPLELYPSLIACALCVEAIREGKEGRRENGWLKLTQANWWLGGGLFAGWVEADQYKIYLASKAATARHAENREIAERIKKWYSNNRHYYRSMDSAAEAASSIEMVSFRTARKHIGDAAKLLRSARKA